MLLLQGITIGGIQVPSREPQFIATVAVHVVAGLVATVAGAATMLAPKAPGQHPRNGTLYFWALAVVCITMGVLAILQWPADNELAALGILAFASAFVGRYARRHSWSRWPMMHIPGMSASYVFLLTAFYVDNGPHLPVWRRLPTIAYWVLPAAMGLPLMIRAVWKYRNADRAPIAS
ncbi:MAG: DUF2306 domain-containing protein [bacterium]